MQPRVLIESEEYLSRIREVGPISRWDEACATAHLLISKDPEQFQVVLDNVRMAKLHRMHLMDGGEPYEVFIFFRIISDSEVLLLKAEPWLPNGSVEDVSA